MFLNVTFTLNFHLEKLKMHVLQSCGLKGRKQVVICLHGKSAPMLKQKNNETGTALIVSDLFCFHLYGGNA